MRIVIYDAMSALRARLETNEPAHLMIRGVLNDCIMPGQLTIWAWDSPGGNDARRKIYPRYKSLRPPTHNDIFQALGYLRELIAFTPAWQASLQGFEGDDVIAALVQNFKASKTPILIVTRDGDLNALCTESWITCTAKDKVPVHLVPLYKLTVGDKSDNIEGIPGFGEQAWENAYFPMLKRLLDKALDGESFDDHDIGLARVTPRVAKWLSDPRNIDTLRAMKEVIAPLPMTPEQLDRALIKGLDNPAAREAALQRYLL